MKSHLLKRSWDDLWTHKAYYFGIWLVYLILSSILSYLTQLVESTRLETILGLIVSMALFALLGFQLRSLAYKQLRPDITIADFVAEDVTLNRMGRLAWKQVLLMIFTSVLSFLVVILLLMALALFLGISEFSYNYRVNLQSSLIEIVSSAGIAILILAGLQFLAPFVRSLPYVNVLNVRQGFWASVKEAFSITGQNYFYLLGTMLKIFLVKVMSFIMVIFAVILTIRYLEPMGGLVLAIAIILLVLVFLFLLIPLYIWEQICYARAYVDLLGWDPTK